jgi:endoribonuclease Dicer
MEFVLIVFTFFPQYFYVAEICGHLNPKSSFPGSEYKTFDEYYFKKYGIQIQNSKQPLLDVDYTSGRLNFLTPRYSEVCTFESRGA